MQKLRQLAKLLQVRTTGKSFNAWSAWLLFGVLGLSLAACGGSNEPVGKNGETSLTIQGSDTMEHLTANWAEQFMKTHKGVQAHVRAGDTGSGIASLIDGTIDLAAASRELTDEEHELAHKKGVKLKRMTVAKDAVAVIVNPQNKLSEISLEELRKIYDGELATWNRLDKNSKEAEPVRAFARELGSGTADYFHKHVLGSRNYASSVKLMPSSEAVIGGVMGNRLGIGFVGMSQAHKALPSVKILKLRLLEKTGKTDLAESSSEKSLSGEHYPLSRPLMFYYEASKAERVQHFLDYCLSKEGQEQVREAEFMTVKP